MRMKVFLFSLIGLLLFMPATFAYHHDMVEAKLPYGSYTSTSHILTVDKPSKLRLEVENQKDSAGTLLYKVYQENECIDDEDNDKLVRYNETMIRGAIAFNVDRNGYHKVEEFDVQPGRYFIELSTYLELPFIFDTPSCEGSAVLTKID